MVTKIDASMFDAQGKEIILDADADTSITADTDDQIDIKIGGADIFQMTATALDINGKELILDADADTSITADTDDQIDIKIAGADDFQFTANTFTAQSGSTIAAQALTATTITATGVVTIPDGSVSAPAISNSGDANTGVYFPAADTVGITAGGTEQFRFGSNPIPGGGKNMIINGAMTVNQRGSITATVNTELLDRFASTLYDAGTSAVATVTKDSDSPTGFGSSMKFDVTTIATGGGDYNYVRQRIEGQNLQHLKYGTADAVTCTFSFWFKTTITGIYSVYFWHVDAAHRTYIREFTVSSADTWEFHEVTVPGYTSTAFDNDANASLEIGIVLASDSLTGAVDSWVSGALSGGSTNQVNGLSSTSNNIYTTGWQFEVGSIATDFEHEDYGTTLQKCLRYFWDPLQGGGDTAAFNGMQLSTTRVQAVIQYPVRMRAAPTFAVIDTGSTGDGIQVQDHGTAAWMTSTSWAYANQQMGWLAVDWSGAIGETSKTMRIYSAHADTRMQWSAEL